LLGNYSDKGNFTAMGLHTLGLQVIYSVAKGRFNFHSGVVTSIIH